MQLILINARAYYLSTKPEKIPEKYFTMVPGLTNPVATKALKNETTDKKEKKKTEKAKTEKVQEKKTTHSAEDEGPVTKKRLSTLNKLIKKYGDKTKAGIIAERDRVEKLLKTQHGRQPGQKKKRKHQRQTPSEHPKCSFCGRSGHTVAQCWKKKAQHSKEKQNKPETSEKKKKRSKKIPTKCEGCGKVALHKRENCWGPFGGPPGLLKEEHKGKGRPPKTSEVKFSYMVDHLDSQMYKVPTRDLPNLQAWIRKGVKARMETPNQTWVPVDERTDQEIDFDEQEENARNESSFFADSDYKVQYANYVNDKRQENGLERKIFVKEKHARTSISQLKNIVRVLDSNLSLIAHGTLLSPTLVGMLKHYWKEATPAFVQKDKKMYSIIECRDEVTEAEDYWVIGRLGKEAPYTSNKLKVPTTHCRGLLLAQGGFESIKVNIGVDKIRKVDPELTYHGISNPTECGFTVIDSEDDSVVGLNAGKYENTGVAFGVPVTAGTLVLYHSFL
jgi:hypothetical protein